MILSGGYFGAEPPAGSSIHSRNDHTKIVVDIIPQSHATRGRLIYSRKFSETRGRLIQEVASNPNLHQASKIENYRTELESITNWEDFLLENSGLPGHRGPHLDQVKRDGWLLSDRNLNQDPIYTCREQGCNWNGH